MVVFAVFHSCSIEDLGGSGTVSWVCQMLLRLLSHPTPYGRLFTPVLVWRGPKAPCFNQSPPKLRAGSSSGMCPDVSSGVDVGVAGLAWVCTAEPSMWLRAIVCNRCVTHAGQP